MRAVVAAAGWLLAAALAVGGAAEGGAAPAQEGVIELRTAARVAPGRPVTLADVASLEGSPALALGGVVMVEDPAERAGGAFFVQVTVDDVREALRGSEPNWGRLSLRGSVCVVRFREPERAQVEPARAVAAPPAPATVALEGVETVRVRVARLVGRMFGVENEDLRLLFDGADGAFLDEPVGARRVEAQPGSSPSSAHLVIVVWVYEGDRLIESRSVRVATQVRREVVVVTSDIARGAAIPRDALRAERMWTEPGGAAPVPSVEAAAGMHARRKIAAGTVLRTDVVESPLAIRKGDLVTVHCVSGGVVVKAFGRAKSDAREGEVVELVLDKGEKSFRARAAGKGRAVMSLER